MTQNLKNQIITLPEAPRGQQWGHADMVTQRTRPFPFTASCSLLHYFGGEREGFLRRVGPNTHAIRKAGEKRLKFEVKQLKEHHH